MIGYEELRAELFGSAHKAVQAHDGPLAAGLEEIEFQVMEAGLDLNGLDRVAREYTEAALDVLAAGRLTLPEVIASAFARGAITTARVVVNREKAGS